MTNVTAGELVGAYGAPGVAAIVRILPRTLGLITLVTVALLLAWDAAPSLFPSRAHDVLGAVPLALIALTDLVHEAVRRATPPEFLKATLLALAFLFWAANQLLPDLAQATLFNDVAIGLFVLDVFWVIIGWPSTPKSDAFPGAE